jgi:DNA-directed RNA polymerase II subunit RPB2
VVRPVFRFVAGAIGALPEPPFVWDDLLRARVDGAAALLEYIDADEQNTAYIAMRPSDLVPGNRFTHCEIDPSTIFGVLASCIPFPDHNQSPRNTYQCAMGKQALGVYMTNYPVRMDKTAFVLSYPHRPLVDTRVMDMLELNAYPSGMTVIVAIMAYTGYNQEDSVILNQGFVDRCGFQTKIFYTEKDEDKKVHGQVEVRCNPDPARTKGMKFGNYGKLDVGGVVPPNTRVADMDIIMGKTVGIKEARGDLTQVIKHEDRSRCYRTDEPTFVQANYHGVNGDGYSFLKCTLRVKRKPVVGDKFSSRHGQKGTVGKILPEADMPRTAGGLIPHIIINPHAIPSRMTIAQLKETLLGKVLLELGLFGDGTAFSDLSIAEISKELLKLGYEQHGEETMYSGITGARLDTTVFIGPCFYQRLKHMVDDKVHSRAQGPMVSLTRQPTEGRARDGGLRIGEMERDCMVSHGATAFLRGRMYDASDRYVVHACARCGKVAAFNDKAKIHLCHNCGNSTSFARVQLPYACKLFSQELMTMGVNMRLITSFSAN